MPDIMLTDTALQVGTLKLNLEHRTYHHYTTPRIFKRVKHKQLLQLSLTSAYETIPP